MSITYKKINKELLVLVIILSYGFLLTNPSIGIDDENFDFYFKYDNLLRSGRWGYYILKKILPTYKYLPVWRDGLALLVLFINMFLMINLIDKVYNCKLPNSVVNAVILIGMSYPIMTRMFLYIDNSLDINIAFLCGILGYTIIREKKSRHMSGCVWSLVVGGGLLILGNAINENCSVFYCIFMCLMVYFDEISCKRSFIKMVKDNLLYVIILGGALICKSPIGHFLAASKGVDYSITYAQQFYVVWGIENWTATISNFCDGFLKNQLFFLEKYFSVKLFVVAMIIWGIEAVYCAIKKEFNRVLAIAGSEIFSLSMFLLTANAALPMRMFTTNLVIVSITFVLIYEKLMKCNKQFARYAYILLVFYVIFFGSKESNELYQLDYLRYQRDVSVADNVNDILVRKNGGNPEIPVIFLGGISGYPDINPEGEAALHSIYTQNLQGESIRIHKFFEMHGYNYPNPMQEDITIENYNNYLNNPLIKQAKEYAVNMPSYPNEGCIEILDDMIIVKLTEYTWGEQ